MAATPAVEQNKEGDLESPFINNDPKLAEMFPEELSGWHG